MLVYGDLSEEKILVPKPIRKFNHCKNNKRKKQREYFKNQELIFNDISINKKFDLENISIDEINNDFLSLASNSEEEEECFNELSKILFSFSEEKSLNIHLPKQNKIIKPKNTK